MKKKIALALCIMLLLAVMLPVTAFARGGRHCGGRGAANTNPAPRYALCTVSNCDVYGPHEHGGRWYCNQPGVNWNDYAVCKIEGCAELGLHEHDGTWYHCAGYPYGGERGSCWQQSR